MPTYQYACTVCGHRFDAVQSFSDASLTECPQCAGLLRKVFSSVGIVFKGSGFYRTDSRSGASTVPAGEAAASSTSSSEGSKSNGSTTDSGAKTSTSAGSGSSGSSASSSPAAAAS